MSAQREAGAERVARIETERRRAGLEGDAQEPLTRVQKWAGQFHTHWVSDQATFENYHHYLGKSAAPQATAPPSPRVKK